MLLQYTFLNAGTFKKEAMLYGQLVNVKENKEKNSIKEMWFTLNNQIFLTENAETKSLTCFIANEKITIKALSNYQNLIQ